ncbi:Uu.00g087480.m01.CDS01 [Anthostomella pinea]|uniref:Uu.00g087480.m01.CDS01 n=1 Tax=Anthostomella pinea TaxID=933095 RepID=A0AAI8YK10_9PEZI|nr:Uu.00g087480.m01.CDS01 [Anthostomella pinea]
MAFKSATALALLGASSVDAFFRMECRGSTGLARMDPIMDAGTVSGHVHTVHGSSGFSLSATFDDLRNGQCTSCAVEDDLSAYWTPALYWHDYDTDEFSIVQQVGGMLAYYLQRGDNVTAFPAGFQMISGSNYRRDYTVGDPASPDPPQSNWAMLKQTGQDDLAQRALGFNCLNYKKDPEASLFRHYMPDKEYLDANCPDGLRLELMFPSCWNGETTSADHKSHVAFPDLVGNGNCPDTHTQRLVTLFYETIWATADSAFGSNGEFVISNGDPTGFGYHGDFMAGWDPEFLQQALDECTNDSGLLSDCPVFTNKAPLKSEDEMRQCKFDVPQLLAKENCAATDMKELPGGVQVQAGPESATPPGDSDSYPTARITSDSTTSKYSAPTLTYSPAASSSTAPMGGAFLETSESSADDVNVLATSSSSSSSSTAIAPATTVAPVVASEPGVSYEVVSTQTVTTGVQVEEIVWKEPIVYVTEDTVTTVTVSSQEQKRRRDHAWRHRHGRGQ